MAPFTWHVFKVRSWCDVLVLNSFLLPSNIPLDVSNTFCISSPQLMHVWIVSTLGQLWIMLLCIFVYKFKRCTFSFLLSTYLGVPSLNHMVTFCLQCFYHIDFLHLQSALSTTPYPQAHKISNSRKLSHGRKKQNKTIPLSPKIWLQLPSRQKL